MNPSLPGGATAVGELADGVWSAGGRVGYTFLSYTRLQQGTTDAPNPGDLAIDVHLATLQAYATAPTGTSLDLQLPIGSLATRMIGGERTDDGLGDLELRVRQSLARWLGSPVMLGATLGAVMPTGGYVARSGAANLPPEAAALALGRGVPWWLAEADARVAAALRVTTFAQLSGRGPLGRTRDEFAWGREVRLTAGAEVLAITRRLSVLASSDLQWRGRASEPDPFAGGRVESANVGGWQWTVSPAVRVDLVGGLALTAGLRVPLYNDVVGNQLVPDTGAFVALSYARRVDTPRPLGAALTRAKQGQLRVVDYWASWCKPCEVIAADLERAASRWPDVEVIRVDASAWPGDDAPTLPAGVTGLPVVEIFDEHGTRKALLIGDDARRVVETVDQLRETKGQPR